MTQNIAIVLIEVNPFVNGRDVAEVITGNNYDTTDDVLNDLKDQLKSEEGFDNEGDVNIYSLDNFVAECNEQEINLENYWVAHITLNTEI